MNKLSLNVGKTKFIIFRTPRKLIPSIPTITINSENIEKVTEIKFLGVYIDELMNWKFHIIYKSKVIAKNLAVIHRIKNLVPIQIRKTLYYSLIHPHLSYGVLAWGNTRSKEIKHLKTLQKRSVRFVIRARYNSHSKQIFHSLDILTIDDLFNMQCCKLFLRSMNNILPQYFINTFRTVNDRHNYATRQQDNLRPPTAFHNIQNQLLSVKVAKIWNHLPQTIRQYSDNSINTFCNKYHNYLINQYPLICEIRNCYICQI